MRTVTLFLLLAVQVVAQTYDVRLQILHAGQPVPAALCVLQVDGAVAAGDDTDDQGWVRFDGLATERFEVVVTKTGYFDRRSVFFNFTRKDIVGAVPVKKRVKWALSGSVRGRGPRGTALVAGAQVSLLAGGDAPASATTGADGTFMFRELYDTECRFKIEAAGWHPSTTWAANRTQQDLNFDVELRPRAAGPADRLERGAPEPVLALERLRLPALAATPAQALATLARRERAGPDGAGPSGSLTGARITCPDGRRLSGVFAAVDRALARRVQPFPRGVRSRIGVPGDGGITGWVRKARRGR